MGAHDDDTRRQADRKLIGALVSGITAYAADVSRTRLWIALAALALVVALVAYRSLAVTDRDRVERFAEAVSGEVTPARVDAAMRYVDPDRQPVEVTAYESTESYGPGQRDALRTMVRERLRAASGARFRVLRRSITMGPRSASVSMQLYSSEAMPTTEYVLRKHGDDWLVETARVR